MNSITLTPAQQADVDSAREFVAASREGRAALAAHLETSAEPVDSFYPIAYGAALARIGYLLTIIADLTGGAS